MAGAKSLTHIGLSERHSTFVATLARTGDAGEAAIKAGYAYESGWRLSKHPAIMAALDAELRYILASESAPLALKALHAILKDEKRSDRVRIDAAKILLDRAGFVPPSKSVAPGDKTLSEMSAEELRAFIDQHEGEIGKIEGELAERAVPVNVPVDGTTDDKALSFLD